MTTDSDYDNELIRRSLIIHRRAKKFAADSLASLSEAQVRAIAYDALYFAASSRLALTFPESESSDYTRGYITALDDALHQIPLDLNSITQ